MSKSQTKTAPCIETVCKGLAKEGGEAIGKILEESYLTIKELKEKEKEEKLKNFCWNQLKESKQEEAWEDPKIFQGIDIAYLPKEGKALLSSLSGNSEFEVKELAFKGPSEVFTLDGSLIFQYNPFGSCYLDKKNQRLICEPFYTK
jgi:hypothetical protein